MIEQLTLKEFAKKVSQRTSVPGGGAVLGVVACLGVSLISMSLEFSIKKISKEEKKRLKEFLKFLNKKRKEFLKISEKDMVSYLKKDDFRSASLELKELLNAIIEVIKKTKSSFKVLNKNLISDFYLGLKLLDFSFKGGVLILKENYIFTRKRKKFIKNLIKRFEKTQKIDFIELDEFLKERHGKIIRGKKF